MKSGRERGVALLVTMLLLVAVLLLGASASTMALLGERSARAERDRLIAFHAAEDALMDAENDIESGRSPVVIPTPPAPPGPPVPAPPPNPSESQAQLAPVVSASPATQPLPHPLPPGAEQGAATAWQAVDLAGAEAKEFGALSGAVMETGQGTLPFRRPRYFAERLERPAGGHYYRVTVIGFGNRPDTEVVLQTTYRRKADTPPGPAGRLSWREIANWRELHATATAAAAGGKKDQP